MPITRSKTKDAELSLLKYLLSKKQAKNQRFWTDEDKKTVFQTMMLYDNEFNPRYNLLLRLKEIEYYQEIEDSVYGLESFSVSRINRTSRNFPTRHGPELSNKEVFLNEDYPVNIIVLDSDAIILKADDYRDLSSFVLSAYSHNPHDCVLVKEATDILTYPINFNDVHCDDIIRVDYSNIEEVRNRFVNKNLEVFVPRNKADLDVEYDDLLSDSIQHVLQSAIDDKSSNYDSVIPIDYVDNKGRYFSGLDTAVIKKDNIISTHRLVMVNGRDILPVYYSLNSKEIIDMFSTVPGYMKTKLVHSVQHRFKDAATKISVVERDNRRVASQIKL